MRKFNTLLITALIFFGGCNTLNNEDNEVSAEISEEKVSVRNGTNETIWFAAFETELLPFINYALSSYEANMIKKGETRVYSNENNNFGKLEKGEKITVLYWSKIEPKDDEIKSIEIIVK